MVPYSWWLFMTFWLWQMQTSHPSRPPPSHQLSAANQSQCCIAASVDKTAGNRSLTSLFLQHRIQKDLVAPWTWLSTSSWSWWAGSMPTKSWRPSSWLTESSSTHFRACSRSLPPLLKSIAVSHRPTSPGLYLLHLTTNRLPVNCPSKCVPFKT